MEGRLIIDDRRDPHHNMAVDQVLLETVAAGAPPVLRFYQWDRPTLSLGYFQTLRDRLTHDASRGLTVVRRSTGGGAIVHDHELTYSLTMPIVDRAAVAVRRFYDVMHDAIRQALQQFGVHVHRVGEDAKQVASSPFLCFQRRTDEDLICAGYKVLGSAQRRTGHAVLQHGSLLLRASAHAPELPGAFDLGGDPPAVPDLIQTILQAVDGRRTKVDAWVPSRLERSEQERAGYWSTERFANRHWLERR